MHNACINIESFLSIAKEQCKGDTMQTLVITGAHKSLMLTVD